MDLEADCVKRSWEDLASEPSIRICRLASRQAEKRGKVFC
jgi:hypothetical protein